MVLSVARAGVKLTDKVGLGRSVLPTSRLASTIMPHDFSCARVQIGPREGIKVGTDADLMMRKLHGLLNPKHRILWHHEMAVQRMLQPLTQINRKGFGGIEGVVDGDKVRGRIIDILVNNGIATLQRVDRYTAEQTAKVKKCMNEEFIELSTMGDPDRCRIAHQLNLGRVKTFSVYFEFGCHRNLEQLIMLMKGFPDFDFIIDDIFGTASPQNIMEFVERLGNDMERVDIIFRGQKSELIDVEKRRILTIALLIKRANITGLSSDCVGTVNYNHCTTSDSMGLMLMLDLLFSKGAQTEYVNGFVILRYLASLRGSQSLEEFEKNFDLANLLGAIEDMGKC